MGYQLALTNTFLAQLRGLADARMTDRVMAAIEQLQRDPRPNGGSRKKLERGDGDLFRDRVGDYRIIYTFDNGWIDLLSLEPRKNDYRGLDRLTERAPPPARFIEKPGDGAVIAPPGSESQADADPILPRPIDEALLRGLQVPARYHDSLLSCTTLNELCQAAVPYDILNWVFDCVTEPDHERVLEAPRLVIEKIADLKSAADGAFVSFLLRLDPEQEQVLASLTEADGPVLLTGGPGSGKSVVALYATKSILQSLRRTGIENPRLLFTTYTNALARSSRQQLAEILGADCRRVEVSTVDRLAKRLVESVDGRITIERDAGRGGISTTSGETRMTWSQLRLRALRIVQSNRRYQCYDAVIVDEAQDLEPAALRLLQTVCRDAGFLLVTADANQSIYRSGAETEQVIDFGDRIWTLKTSHRTTREIMIAAWSYAGDGQGRRTDLASQYPKSGPRPFVRVVPDADSEAEVLATYLSWATSQNRVGYGGCAVLAPTNPGGVALSTRLNQRGLRAEFMSKDNFNLSAPVVKVLTLHTAKGLEFPVVAIAGFFDGNLPEDDSARRDYAQSGAIGRSRRAMFVGMTRAMRTLLVLRPHRANLSYLDGFDRQHWDIRSWEHGETSRAHQ